MRLAGQVAVVTGASRGIGRAIAARLAREGAAVVLAARSAGAIAAAAAEIERGGGRAEAVPADVRDEAAVETLARTALDRHGRIDVLVAAAGVAAFADVAGASARDWDEMMAVNLRGAFLCARAVLPAMMAQGQGTIIAVGSMVTGRTLPGSGAYTASKYGLLGFCRVLAEEMRGHGVRVGVLSAGAVDTPLWDATPNGPDRTLMIRVEQVAEAAALMASLDRNAVLEELLLMPARGVL
jgi:NAD(P)-dependent dehydrogenase (short-subunit alcohol dehydrogenase family)